MEQWTGKVAIVTGASVGIGAAIVVKLLKCGVHVVALARRENKLKVNPSEILIVIIILQSVCPGTQAFGVEHFHFSTSPHK